MYLSVSSGHIDVASPERLELPVAACSLCGCQDQDCPDKNMCTYKWNQTKDKWWSMNTVVLLDKLLLTVFFPKKGLTSSVIFCHFLGKVFFWYHKHKVRVCKMFLHLLQSLLIYIFLIQILFTHCTTVQIHKLWWFCHWSPEEVIFCVRPLMYLQTKIQVQNIANVVQSVLKSE